LFSFTQLYCLCGSASRLILVYSSAVFTSFRMQDKRLPLLCKLSFFYDHERLLFKQTYLRRRSTLLGQSFDDFVIFCIQMTEYLLDHQWVFSRHIPVSNPTGSMRCANRLSYRFVDARYNLAPPYCSQVSISISKNHLSHCDQVINWCFCAQCFFAALTALLV
jgi:hypothetical protein